MIKVERNRDEEMKSVRDVANVWTFKGRLKLKL